MNNKRTYQLNPFLKMKPKQHIIAILIALIYVVLYAIKVSNWKYIGKEIILMFLLGFAIYSAISMFITKKALAIPTVYHDKSLAYYSSFLIIAVATYMLYQLYFGS